MICIVSYNSHIFTRCDYWMDGWRERETHPAYVSVSAYEHNDRDRYGKLVTSALYSEQKAP